MVTLSLRLEEAFTASPVFLYVHEDHKYYVGRGAQDGHPDLHTAPKLCRLHLSFFHNALRPRTPYGLLGTGKRRRVSGTYE